MGLISR